MKKICFCFKIHISTLIRKYRFFDIEHNHRYYSDVQIREHVKKHDANVIIPFLEMLKSLSLETGGRFKAGVSISGTTLNLLNKIVPDTIVKMQELTQNNCIEFLSEPWSHSILPFTDKKLFAKQISRHDELINMLLGKTPKVFIAHSPLCSLEKLDPILTKQKKGIFAYTNHFTSCPNKTNDFAPSPSSFTKTLLINNKASKILQKTDFDPHQHKLAHYVARVQGQINKNISPQNPTIVVYNLLQSAKSFHLNHSLLWQTILKRLLYFYGFQYCLPSEMVNQFPQNTITTTIDKKVERYQLPDYWLANKMQREVFKNQLKLNSLIKQEKNIVLRSNWNFIQDMDNLFFMNDHFFKAQFSRHNFSPYLSPYMAYINYMNVIDDMMWRLKKRQSKSPQKRIPFAEIKEAISH